MRSIEDEALSQQTCKPTFWRDGHKWKTVASAYDATFGIAGDSVYYEYCARCKKARRVQIPFDGIGRTVNEMSYDAMMEKVESLKKKSTEKVDYSFVKMQSLLFAAMIILLLGAPIIIGCWALLHFVLGVI